MEPEIKNMKTWKEAERWLAKHGWGMSQIAQQKELWEKDNKVEEPAVQAQKPEKSAAQAQKPEKTAVQAQKPEKTDNKK